MPSKRFFPFAADKTFKALMRNIPIARDILRHSLSPLSLRSIELSGLELLPTEYHAAFSLKQYTADMVFRAPLRVLPGAPPEFVYIIVEHQSSPGGLTPMHIREVASAIIRRHFGHKKPTYPLPAVISLIISSDAVPYSGRTQYFECFSEIGRLLVLEQLFGHYGVLDLQKLSLEEIQAYEQGRPLVYGFKQVHHESFEPLLCHIVAMILELHAQGQFSEGSAKQVLERMINYLQAKGKEVPEQARLEQVFQQITDTLPPILEEVMRNAISIWIEKGIKEGMEKGREEGREEVIAKTLRAIDLLKASHSITVVMEETGLNLQVIESLHQKLQGP